MSVTVTDDAVGKDVVNSDGDTIGIVSAVRHGTAYVTPDPGVTDKLRATLGWEDTDEDSYPLQEEAIGTVTEDEIRLQHDI